jgi:hypothetical protein
VLAIAQTTIKMAFEIEILGMEDRKETVYGIHRGENI